MNTTDKALWTFTMDAEDHVTLFRNRQEVWSGSFEAFMADADHDAPESLVEKIHARYDRAHNVPRCPDCGERNEIKGHMGCQYPQD